MEKDLSGGEGYWVPECVRSYLRAAGTRRGHWRTWGPTFVFSQA